MNSEKSRNSFEMKIACELKFVHCFLINFTYACNVRIYIFYQAFLNFINSLMREVNQSWFPHKETLLARDLNYTDLNNTNLYYFHSFPKF